MNDQICGELTYKYKFVPVGSAVFTTSPNNYTDINITGGSTETINGSISFTVDPGDGTYEGKFIVADENLVPLDSISVFSVFDRVNPTTPSVTASNTGCNVTLTWNDSYDATSGVDYYEIRRDGVVINQTTTAGYTDNLSGMSSGQVVSYEVRAFDKSGLVSSWSAAATVQMPTIVISNIKTSKRNSLDCYKTVTWTTNVPTSSTVRFSSSCSDLDQIATGAGNTTSHSVECYVYDETAFAFSVESSDGCVTAASTCTTVNRGICISQ